MDKKKTRKFNSQGYIVYERFANGKKAASDSEGSSRIKQKNLSNSINIYKIVGNYTPTNFISKIYKSKNTNIYRDFLDLETYKLSALVPDVSLYKVWKGKYIPFYFPVSSDNVTRESVLGPGTGIFAAGIKNISVSYTGNNPFSFDKQVDCSVTIYVDNIENIFRSPAPGYAPLAELFTISRTNSKSLGDGVSKEVSSAQVQNANSFEIALKMGYKFSEASRILTKEEMLAVRDTNVTIRMTLYDHTINVNQDGSANIDINYIGRLEGVLSDSMYDIVREPQELITIASYRAGQKSDKQVNKTEEEKERLERIAKSKITTRLRKLFTYLTDDHNQKSKNQRIHDFSLSNIDLRAYRNYQESADLYRQNEESLESALNLEREYSQLQSENNLRSIVIQEELEKRRTGTPPAALSLETFGAKQTTQNLGNVASDLSLGGYSQRELDDTTTVSLELDADNLNSELMTGRKNITDKRIEIEKLKRERQKNKNVSYVYIGDIVESVCHHLAKGMDEAIKEAKDRSSTKDMTKEIEVLEESKKSLRSMKILFSTVPINTGRGKNKYVNIADIPIDISILGKYFFDEIEQMSKHKFSVKVFLDDLCCKLIHASLSSNIVSDVPAIASNIEIRSLLVTGPKSDKMDNSRVEVDVDDLPDFHTTSKSIRSDSDNDYYIVYSESTESASSGLKGNMRDDIRNGIYHLQIGKNRGMLKNVSFSKFDIPGRREALMIESVSLFDQLKMPYTAQISMFGNNFFLPGMMIYLNPSSIGFGDPRSKNSAAFQLGLGGYYQIISVNTSFDGSTFNTDLTTSYVSWADSDSSFSADLQSVAPSAPNRSPEIKENEMEPSDSLPSYQDSKASDYDTIRMSNLLTEAEKSDIIQSELGGINLEEQNISKNTSGSGERSYTVKRSNRQNIVVTVGDDNQTNIRTERK